MIADTPVAFEGPQIYLGSIRGLPQGAVSLPLPLRLGALADQILYLLSNRTRMAGRGDGPVVLGDFTLDPENSLLIHKPGGEEIRLTDKERLLLLTLYEAPGYTMERKSLLEAVWGYAESVETHTLETHLYRLRQKLEASGGGLIVSVDGGYRLAI